MIYNILITGANGFCGKMSKNFLYNKNFRLFLTDKNINNKTDKIDKLDILIYKDLDRYIKKNSINVIIHLASEIFDQKEKFIWSNNIICAHNIAKASINNNSVKQIIFTSTFSLFEQNYKNKITEIMPATAKNIYGRSKAECERIFLSLPKKIDVTIFRCPIIIDKTRAHRIAIFFEFIKDNKTLWIVGGGNNKLHFLGIEDFYQFIYRSVGKKAKNVYNIGCDKVYSLKELFYKMIKKNRSKSKVKYLPKNITLIVLWLLSKMRLIDFTSYHNTLLVSNIVLDISKAKKELNYIPKYDSFKIFNDAYLYYKNNKDNYLRGSSQKPKMKILKLIKFFS
jgi:nucleoside-diphosphate-sugar epimerase